MSARERLVTLLRAAALPTVAAAIVLVGTILALRAERIDLTRQPILVFDPFGPNDANGTAWFYAWTARALQDGLAPLWSAWLCAPRGAGLGEQFVNRVDALFAAPFLLAAGYPTGFNLAILAMVVAEAIAAWAFLRAAGASQTTASLGAVAWGLMPYRFAELASGRPVSAFTLPLVLALGAMIQALRTRGLLPSLAWAAAAGLAGNLVLRTYAPWVVVLAPVALGVVCARMLVPAEGVSRWRVAALAVSAIAVAAFTAAPYVAEVELRSDGGAPLWTLWPWEPAVYEALGDMRSRLSGGTAMGPSRIADIQDNSLALRTIFEGAPSSWTIHALRMGGLGALVALACVIGGRAPAAWALGAAFAAVAALGPVLRVDMLPNNGGLFQLADGRLIVLPTYWFAEAMPSVARVLRPYRAIPVFDACALAAVALTADRALGWAKTRGPRWGGALRVALVVGTLVAVAVPMGVVRGLENTKQTRVPAVAAYLRDAPLAGALVELPLGLGHGTGSLQAVHQRARAEAAGDTLDRGVSARACGADAPPEGLRGVDLASGGAPTPAALDALRAAGFAYVVVYDGSYRRLRRDDTRSVKVAVARLTEALGAPVYADRDAHVFAL